MQTLPVKLTNRKFYNKWLYKVTLNINGGNLMRYNNMLDVARYCVINDPDNKIWGWNNKVYSDKEDLYKIAYFLSNKDKSLWSKRVERDYIDFYTNDESMFEELSTLVPERIKHRFAPENQAKDILEDASTNVAVKKLPHNIDRKSVV